MAVPLISPCGSAVVTFKNLSPIIARVVDILIERFRCRGHPNVRATHRSTLEFTRERYLTPRGDCILCVAAEKAVGDLSEEFKDALRSGARLIVTVRVGDVYDTITAWGSADLPLSDGRSMVIRRSNYVDPRTLAVRADKAARDVNRKLVELLRNPETVAHVELRVEDGRD
ncbi:MAG: DUF371 domain-containing protein [Thermococci archaeon]|nr:DUF371 domain-containing protein [Thermococci archaeon]